MMRRFMLLAATVVAAFLLGTTPAWAHGGPIEIAAQSDGGQGITATVSYTQDHHPVSDEVVMTYTAISDKGKTIGPLPLKASAEGQSFYVSKNPLPLGKWTVTITATQPSAASKTISLTSAKLPPVNAPATATASSGLPIAVVVAIPVVVLIIALAVVLDLRRRRSLART